jgi:hypothetical protein
MRGSLVHRHANVVAIICRFEALAAPDAGPIDAIASGVQTTLEVGGKRKRPTYFVSAYA